MNIKKLVMSSVIGAIALGISAFPAFAAPSVHLNIGSFVNAGQGDTTGQQVLNISYKIYNDPDSGFYGNWATDSFNKRVQVWQQTDGTYCGVAKYDGQFVTTGPNSPQNGVSLSAGIKGTFEGGYVANFDGTLNSGHKTNGYLGAFDQSTGGFDWLGTYFSSNTFFKYPNWAWVYHAGNNGSWVNAATSSFGDITGN